jgi:hypothetical protein
MANIYASADRKRFFMVPEGTELRPGDLELSSLTNEKVKVDADDVARFEVPEAEAKEAVMKRMASLKQITQELHDLASRITAAVKGIGEPVAEAGRARVEQILGAIGVSLADLEKDPQGTLKTVGDRMKTLAQEKLAAIMKQTS